MTARQYFILMYKDKKQFFAPFQAELLPRGSAGCRRSVCHRDLEQDGGYLLGGQPSRRRIPEVHSSIPLRNLYST